MLPPILAFTAIGGSLSFGAKTMNWPGLAGQIGARSA